MDEVCGVSMVDRGGGGVTWRFWCISANGLTLNYLGANGLILNYLEKMV